MAFKKFEFKYESQEQLKFIFNLLRDTLLETTLTLEPRVSNEFITAWENMHIFLNSRPQILDDESKKMLLSLSEIYQEIAIKEKVHPYVRCMFNDIYKYQPQLTFALQTLYLGYSDFTKGPILNLEGFLGKENWRYRFLNFESINDEVQLKDIKSFIEHEVPSNYEIKNFFIKLNPEYSTSDHYYTRERNDGTMYSHNGIIYVEYKDTNNIGLQEMLQSEAGIKLLET